MKLIRINNRSVYLHSGRHKPDFAAATVLCGGPWDFVSLWMKKNQKDEALFYWEQAKHFYEASCILPEISAPLTSYYCILNATKALLLSHNIQMSDRPKHGVSGTSESGKVSLKSEHISLEGCTTSTQMLFKII